MISDYGTIVNVYISTIGDELAADAPLGSVTLTVVDPGDFSEDGGQAQLGGGEVVVYTSCDDDTGILTLLSATTAAHVTGDRVDDYPIGQEKYAQVLLNDEDEAIEARVPHALYDKILEGVRSGRGETCLVELDETTDAFIITDLLGAVPRVDGTYLENIDPSSVSDGLPPALSPTPVVLGGIGTIFVRWTGITNADAVTYDVYISPTSGFTPGPTTLAQSTNGTAATIRALPDNTALAYYVDPAATPLVKKLYYVKIVARDIDGSAAASSEASGSMTQATGPDIAANTITGDNILGNTITGDLFSGNVILGSTISTGSIDPVTGLVVGSRVDIGPDGLFTYDADGVTTKVELPIVGTSVFRGDAEIGHLTVNDGTFEGGECELAQGATFTLSTGVTPPTNPPTVAVTHATTTFGGTAWDSKYGLAYDGTYWYTLAALGGPTMTIQKWDSTGALVTYWNVAGSTAYGIVYDGTNLLCFGENDTGPGDPVTYPIYKVNPSTGATVSSSFWPGIDGSKSPAIGWDSASSEVLIAQTRASTGTLRVRRWTYVAGSDMTPNVAVDSAFSWTANLAGNVLYGSFDLGANRYVLKNIGAQDFVVMDTLGNEVTSEEWPMGGGAAMGQHWDGTNFWHMTRSGVLYKYEAGNNERWTTTTANGTWDIAYTWYNSVGPTETTRSPAARISMAKRARLKLTSASLPVGADTVRFFAKRGTAAPAAFGSLFLQGTSTASPPSYTITNLAITGTVDPSTNTFGAATPALMQSTSGGFNVNGAGVGSWPLGTVGYRCLVRRTADQTALVTGTNTLVVFNVEDTDPDNISNGAGLFTVPVNGIYHIVCNVNFASNATGRRQLQMNRNSATATTNALSYMAVNATVTGSTSVNMTWEDRLVAGDVLRIWAQQGSGGNLDLVATNNMPSLSLRYVGA